MSAPFLSENLPRTKRDEPNHSQATIDQTSLYKCIACCQQIATSTFLSNEGSSKPVIMYSLPRVFAARVKEKNKKQEIATYRIFKQRMLSYTASLKLLDLILPKVAIRHLVG